jgi:hypothetical protein
MSIFAKKPDWEQKLDGGPTPSLGAPHVVAKGGGYGIAEAIQLLRSLPVDQGGDLVVRVVGATLASVDVHIHDIIEDATKRQKNTHDRIAAVHAQIADLEKQLEVQRREVAALEADLKETTNVKERLQQAERAVTMASGRPTPAPGQAAVSGQTPGPQLNARLPREDAARLKD